MTRQSSPCLRPLERKDVFAPEYFDGGNLAGQNREEKKPGALF